MSPSTEQMKQGTCGCGRSPTGNCCGWHALSEDQYQQRKELYETGGEEALMEISRKKQFLANRVEPHIEKAVIDLAIEQPAWGNSEYLMSLREPE